MDSEELKTIIEKHAKWLNGEDGGERADLSYANLSDANLWGANLSYANLSYANLSCANLSCANLSGANLSGANLSGANLWGCAGNRNQIKSLFFSETYPITYTAEYLQIGCERHAIADWWGFDNKRIAEMGGKAALKFWADWKETIRALIEKSPAAPTTNKTEEEKEPAW